MQCSACSQRFGAVSMLHWQFTIASAFPLQFPFNMTSSKTSSDILLFAPYYYQVLFTTIFIIQYMVGKDHRSNLTNRPACFVKIFTLAKQEKCARAPAYLLSSNLYFSDQFHTFSVRIHILNMSHTMASNPRIALFPTSPAIFQKRSAG